MTDKICPICIAGANKYVSRCIGADCVWWCTFSNDCAIPTVAEILADSDVCKTIFLKPEPKKEGDPE